ncbi:MAG: hypothetical protein ACREE9_06610 [Stellaceae bacterium]
MRDILGQAWPSALGIFDWGRRGVGVLQGDESMPRSTVRISSVDAEAIEVDAPRSPTHI